MGNWELLAFYAIVGELIYLGALGIILLIKSFNNLR